MTLIQGTHEELGQLRGRWNYSMLGNKKKLHKSRGDEQKSFMEDGTPSAKKN